MSAIPAFLLPLPSALRARRRCLPSNRSVQACLDRKSSDDPPPPLTVSPAEAAAAAAAAASAADGMPFPRTAAGKTRNSRGRRVRQFFSVPDTFPLPNDSALKREKARAVRLRKRGDWRTAKSILEVLRMPGSADPEILTEFVFVEGLEMLEICPTITPVQVLDELRALFSKFKASPTVATYNAILHTLQQMLPAAPKKTTAHALATNSDNDVLDTAARVLDDMRAYHVVPDEYSLSLLFSTAARAGSRPYINYFRSETAANPAMTHPVARGALIVALAKVNNLDAALTELNNAQQQQQKQKQQRPQEKCNVVSDRAYAAVIAAANRQNRHTDVVATLRTALSQNDVTPTPFMFAPAVASCVKNADALTAAWLLQQMDAAGLDPSPTILRGVFQTALRAGHVGSGATVLFERLATRDDLESEEVVSLIDRLIAAARHAPPDVSSEEVGAAIQDVVRRMQEELGLAPGLSTLNALCNGLGSLGLHSAAQQVIEKDIPEAGLLPDLPAHNALIRSLSRSGQPKLALTAAKRLPELGLQPDQRTYNALMEAATRGCADDADTRTQIEAWLASTERDGTAKRGDMGSITSRLGAMRETGDADAALQLFIDGEKLASSSAGPAGAPVQGRESGGTGRLDDRACGLVLTVLFEAGLKSVAVGLFGRLLWQRRAGVAAYNVMLHHAGRTRDGVAQMERMFQHMKRSATAFPDEVTYTTVIRRCAQHGLVERALRLVAELQDIGVAMTDSFAWTAVIDGCGRFGRWERGVELLRFMMYEGGARADAGGKRDGGSPPPQTNGARGIATGRRGGRVLAPAPSTASYNAGLYAAGLHGRRWDVAREIYQALLADRRVRADAVTYSAMASIILRNRVAVHEVAIVEEVVLKLRELVGEAETAGSGDGKIGQRGRQRASGSYRRGWRLEEGKLRGKLRRLEWVLHHKRRVAAEARRSVRSGASGDDNTEVKGDRGPESRIRKADAISQEKKRRTGRKSRPAANYPSDRDEGSD